MRKKLAALVIAVLQVTTVIGGSVYAADDAGKMYVDLQFDDGQLTAERTGWAINQPEAVTIDGVGAAHIAGDQEKIKYYQFEVKDLALKGHLTIETRVKISTASVFYIKGFLNAGGSLGYSSLMARFNNEKLGAVWVNSDNTSQLLDGFTTDVSIEAPDMHTGWSTIWIDIDTRSGVYTTYMNHRGCSFSGTFAGNADNYLHNLRFGAQMDSASDPAQHAYVDYIKIYSSDLQDIPEAGELNVEVASNFDNLSIGSNLRKSLFNNMSDTASTVTVAADPLRADNQCVSLQSATAQRGVTSVGVSKATLEFSAYLPARVSNELVSFVTDSASFACTTNPNDDNIAYGGSGETGAMTGGAWNDFRFEIDMSGNTNNVLCYLNGALAATKSLAGSKLICVRFGIPAGGTPIYLDDFRLFSDNGTARITASKQNGEMQYGEKVYLTGDIADTEIFYTTDGSRPDETSRHYTDDGIAITANQMYIRAIGVSGGKPGRVYTFGKYSLNSIDGLIVTDVTFSPGGIAAGVPVGAAIGILNTAQPRTAWAAIGVYADGALTAVESAELTLEEGITTEELSVTAPAGYDYRSADARVFVWTSDGKQQTLAEAHGMHDSGMGSKPAISAKNTTPLLADVQCSLNSTGSVLHISGWVTDAMAGQDISVQMCKTDNDGVTAALLQCYAANDGGFSTAIPLKPNIPGGYYTVQIGGRGIQTPVSRSVYYVDEAERAAAVAEINQTKSAAEMLDALIKFQENGILALDFENEIYKGQPETVAKWVYQTKEKAAFENIEAVSDVFLAAAAVIPVLDAVASNPAGAIAHYQSALPFVKEAPYAIDVMQGEKEAAALNRTLAAQFEPLPGDMYAFETDYKTAYAIAQINLAARSEMEGKIQTYNAVLGLDLTGDYQKVSAYEVAKALYDKNYTAKAAIRTDFQNRIRELLSTSSGGSGGSSSGGSSGGKRSSGSGQTLAVPGVPVSVDPIISPQPVDEEPAFSDVGSGHWAYAPVAELKRRNILSGFEDGTFRPDLHITRAELVTMLAAVYALKADDDDLPFADISPDDWYYPAAAAAWRAGVIKGDGQNFRPLDEIRREDMAVMVYRLVAENADGAKKALTFTDADDISDYAYDAVAYLTARGVINGFADGSFCPDGALTRAEGAKILCGILGVR